MNARVFRCSAILILGFGLLMVLSSPAAAGEGPRVSPQAMARFAAVAPPQAAGCTACAFAYQTCTSACFSVGEKGSMGKCLTTCDNAAAMCTCDQSVDLRSEDLVDFEWPSLTKAACHGTVSCQPNYPSCASWSGYSDCGTPFCGIGPRCGDCEYIEGHLFCDPGPAWKQYRERFRVCFDAQQNSCTEWEQIFISSCGC
jgi:hypothetical protein